MDFLLVQIFYLLWAGGSFWIISLTIYKGFKMVFLYLIFFAEVTFYFIHDASLLLMLIMGSTTSVHFSSVAQLFPTLCDPMNHSTPGLPVHHQLLEFTQTHVYWVSNTIQPSHPLSSPSPPTSNPYQHQSLFQWVNSSHEVAKELEFEL